MTSARRARAATTRAWLSGSPSWARTKPPAAAHPPRASAVARPASEERLARPPPHERVEGMSMAGIIRLQTERLPAGRFSLLMPSQSRQHVGKPRVRLRVIGLHPDGLAIGPLAGLVLTLLLQRGPEIEVALRIVGPQAQRLAVDRLRLAVETLGRGHA